MIVHRLANPAAFTAAGGAVITGTFLPWLRTGARERSSYELLGLLDRIGIGDDGAVSSLVRWWPIVPLLVVTAVLLCWWQRPRSAAVAALVSAAYAGGVGTVVVTARPSTGVVVGPGPWLTAAGSALFVVIAVAMVIARLARPELPPRGSVPSAHADTH